MSSVSVWRNDSSGRSLVRSQPAAGFDSRTVLDYECPFEQNVTYDWEATYIDPTSLVTVFNETWASAAAWTVFTGAVSVGSNKVSNTGSDFATLLRNVTSGRYRLTIASLATTGFTTVVQMRNASASVYATVQVESDGTVSLRSPYGLTPTAIDNTQSMTLDLNEDGTATLTGVGGSATMAIGGEIDRIIITFPGGATGTVGAVKVESYPEPDTLAEASDPVQLTPSDAWLIHPSSPGLSFPVAHSDADRAGFVNIGPVERATNTTVHRILGSSTPVTTTTGPRGSDETVVTIETVTTDEATDLNGLLLSDFPILFQIPPSWGLDFNSGYYHVGDVEASRIGRIVSPHREWTLPIVKVTSPVVDVENAQWSYADVAATYTTYADLVATYATYADLASNT